MNKSSPDLSGVYEQSKLTDKGRYATIVLDVSFSTALCGNHSLS